MSIEGHCVNCGHFIGGVRLNAICFGCKSLSEAPADRGALSTQEGGDHYKSLKIQPIEYIHANDLDYFQGNIIKYATRHKTKSGAADLRKAIHYCQLALQMQYGEGSE